MPTESDEIEPPTLDYADPKIAQFRPGSALIRVAFYCWLLPLGFGSIVFLAEMVNRPFEASDRESDARTTPFSASDQRHELFETLGLATICVGIVMAIVAVACLVALANVKSATEDREREIRQPIRRMLWLQFGNFLLAAIMACAGS